MATTAKKSPSTCGAISNEWTNPTYAYSSNNQRAQSTLTEDDDTQDDEDYQGFGFTTSDIPSGSTIDGINVYIEGNSGSATIHACANCTLVVEGAPQFIIAGFIDIVGSRDATYSAAFGPTMPSQAQVCASDFGVHIRFSAISGSTVVAVDHIQLEVEYTEPSATEVVLTEAVVLSDTTQKTLAITRTETLALMDSVMRQALINYSESIALNDATQAALALAVAEQIALLDTQSLAAGLTLSEAIALLHEQYATYLATLQESLALADRKEAQTTGTQPSEGPGTEKRILRTPCTEKVITIIIPSCTEKEIVN